MGQLHEALSTRQTRVNSLAARIAETKAKFAKTDAYFNGKEKTLQMLEDTPANKTLESTSRSIQNLVTTVPETLEYLFQEWNKAEDILHQINRTNQDARADLMFNGVVLLAAVPVDTLLGLESRLEGLRKLLVDMPTLESSRTWTLDQNASMRGVYRADLQDQMVKTEKSKKIIVLYDATDKHPAQVKEADTDLVVGKFVEQKFSGACTPRQKADCLSTLDNLMAEVKSARMRANNTEMSKERIGKTVTDLLLAAFK